jgi:carbon storage regulator
MLVLTRKPNQSIMIGDDVEISVLSVSGDKVRLGITAPKEVPIFRTEVYLNIRDGQGRNGAAEDSPEKVDEALQGLAEGKRAS